MNKQKMLETVTPEVKKELKSPYSAVLCPPEDLRVVPKGQGTDGSKKFTIYGYVDSLPDLKARKAETKNIFDNTSVVNNPSVTNSSATNTYNSSSTANVGYNNTSNPKTNRPSKNGESNLEQWICPECKWINTGTHKGCQKCGYGSYEKNSAVGGWTCPECGRSNLISRITCSKCGIKKPL